MDRRCSGASTVWCGRLLPRDSERLNLVSGEWTVVRPSSEEISEPGLLWWVSFLLDTTDLSDLELPVKSFLL